MKNILTKAASTQPVTLAEMRTQMGITQDDDDSRDAVITSRIKSATRWAEHHTNSAFISQTWTLNVDCFKAILYLKANLQAVNSVNYIDTDGVQQTLDSADYLVDTVNATISPAHGKTWPAIRQQANAIQIEHISGFGAANKVPEDLKEAIKFIVGHWENYQSNIEAAERITTVPYAVTQLLRDYVDMREIF